MFGIIDPLLLILSKLLSGVIEGCADSSSESAHMVRRSLFEEACLEQANVWLNLHLRYSLINMNLLINFFLDQT